MSRPTDPATKTPDARICGGSGGASGSGDTLTSETDRDADRVSVRRAAAPALVEVDRARRAAGRWPAAGGVMATLGVRRRISAPGLAAPAGGSAAAAAGRAAGALDGRRLARLGGVSGRVVSRLPHQAQTQVQPRTGERHTAHRPGGERNSSSRPIGPRITPNGIQRKTARSRRAAIHAAAPPNPMAQADRAMSARGSIGVLRGRMQPPRPPEVGAGTVRYAMRAFRGDAAPALAWARVTPTRLSPRSIRPVPGRGR